MKKLVILIASVFVTSTLTANASLLLPATLGTSSNFTDVNDYTSYASSIEWMKNNDIVSGYADGSFGADQCVNRVEFLKIMYKVQDFETSIDTSTSTSGLFKDTPVCALYIPYVKIAKDQGIVKVYPDNTFRPSQCISRAEAAKIATLSFNNNVMPQNPTTDYYWNSANNYGDISKNSWYYSYLDYTLKSNTIGTEHTWSTYDYNTSLTKFQPNDPMTRKEAAELFFRFKAMSDNQSETYEYAYEPKIKEEKLFYNNCANDLSLPEGLDITIKADILSALPEDSSVVIGADHSNDTQLKNIDKILSTITKQDFWKEASAELAQYDMLIEDDWEAALGISMDGPNDPNPEIVIVGKFEKDNDFESFIKDLVAKEMNYSLTCKNSGGITYWTSSEEEFYFAKFDKFFIVTNTDQDRKQAIERIENNKGFSFSNNLNKDKLAYIYIDKDLIGLIQDELQNEMNPVLNQFVSVLGSIGDVYGYIKSDSDGFLSSIETTVKNSNDPFIKKYIGISPSLVDEVPGKNTLLYAEDVDLSLAFQAMSTEYSTYDNILAEIANELEVNSSSVDELLSSPYAFSIADNGSFLPSMSFYLQFESGDIATVDKAIEMLDKAIDEGIANEGSIGNDVQLSDIVTKTTTNSGLTKLTLDVNNLPTTSNEEVKMKNSLKESGVELYYGILNDNTLVIALYPNFEEYYGSSSLSQDSTFIQAVKKLDGVYGGKLSYFNITNLTEYLSNIMSLLGDDSYIMPSEDEMDTIKDIVGMFKYFISSMEISSSKVMVNSYLRIGK